MNTVKQKRVTVYATDYVAGLAHAQKLIIQLQDAVARLNEIGIVVTCKFKVDPFLDKLKKLIKVRSR